MRVVLAGPLETDSVARSTGVDLRGLPGGSVQTPISLIARGLLDQGHLVHLVTTDAQIDRSETYNRGALSLTFCPLRGAPSYKARLRSRDLFEKEIRFLTEAIQDSGADIVHAHWTYEFAEASVRSGLPHVVTMHDLGWEYFLRYRDAYRFMRLLMKYRTMPRIRNLSVVAPFMRTKAWHYGYFGQVSVVPNSIASVGWRPKNTSRPKIVSVGNDGPIKNIVMAVEAFKLIREQHPDAELHLVGPGLEATSKFVNSAIGIYGHGQIAHAELMTFLAEEATLLIHPSLIETFGVIIGEAKMRGVPVVAGNKSGGVTYVVGDAGGTLVDISSPHSIARAASDILSSKDYLRMQNDAHADMKLRFSIQAVAGQYEAIYRRIIGAPE